MANIMITYRCNLQCPYCFANEFVNKTYTDMTVENFRQAVKMLDESGESAVGLIGGEPTLHPDFEEMILALSRAENIRSVMLYTNGLLLDRCAEILTRPDVQGMMKILVNCNSPRQMGENNFKTLTDNLDLMFGKYHMRDNIKLGVNLYDNDFDYTYLKDLLVRYNLYQIRISLTVPDFSACGSQDVMGTFAERKEYLLQFYRDMDALGVMAYYDCNRPPSCIWTDEEWGWICWYRKKYHMYPSNIAEPESVCSPVIDILPDLHAVRCFGLSEFEKVDIRKFECLADICAYYENLIDYGAFQISSAPQCRDCYARQVKKCTGGCMGFKYEQIRERNHLFT